MPLFSSKKRKKRPPSDRFNDIQPAPRGGRSGSSSSTTAADTPPTSPEPDDWGPLPPLMRGDRFEIGRQLGRGQFAEVLEARDTKTDARVAIKRCSLRRLNKDEARSVRSELQLLSKIDHVNIVRYLGHCKNRETVWSMLEFCEGGTFLSVAKRVQHRLPDAVVALYLQQLLRALGCLHERRVVHRDIKCDNVLLTARGVVKLADMGIAMPASPDKAPKMGAAVGSPYWMAPECVRMEPFDCSADVWSFGVCVIELMTGSPPFFDLPREQALFVVAEGDKEVPFPDNISPALDDVIRKCMRRDAAQRPTIAELLEHSYFCNRLSVEETRKSALDAGVLDQLPLPTTEAELTEPQPGVPDHCYYDVVEAEDEDDGTGGASGLPPLPSSGVPPPPPPPKGKSAGGPPPPPPPKGAPKEVASPSDARKGLLSDICKGKGLKKVGPPPEKSLVERMGKGGGGGGGGAVPAPPPRAPPAKSPPPPAAPPKALPKVPPAAPPKAPAGGPPPPPPPAKSSPPKTRAPPPAGATAGGSTLRAADGRYEGEKGPEGAAEGYGTCVLPGGVRYEGMFQKGLAHGPGTLSWSKGARLGDRYEGEFQEGRWSGPGKYYFSSGERYSGTYKDGKREGEGIFRATDGTLYVVTGWSAGRQVRADPSMSSPFDT